MCIRALDLEGHDFHATLVTPLKNRNGCGHNSGEFLNQTTGRKLQDREVGLPGWPGMSDLMSDHHPPNPPVTDEAL